MRSLIETIVVCGAALLFAVEAWMPNPSSPRPMNNNIEIKMPDPVPPKMPDPIPPKNELRTSAERNILMDKANHEEEAKAEVERIARKIEAEGEAREAELRQELEAVMAEKIHNAMEAKEARKEISSLIQEYQNLEASAEEKDSQHESQLEELQEELKKQESYFADQLNSLKEELRNTVQQAQHKAQDVQTVGESREAELRIALAAVTEENRKHSRLAEAAKNEADRSAAREAKLMQELETVATENSRNSNTVNYLKEKLRNAEEEADLQVQNLQNVGATREAELRQELESTAAENSKHATLAAEAIAEAERIAAREAKLRQELEAVAAENNRHANAVSALKEKLRTTEENAARERGEFRAASAAQETDLRRKLHNVVAENNKHSLEVEKAKREAAISAEREARLRQRLEAVVAENTQRANEAKEAKLESNRRARDIQTAGASREAQLRQTLEVVAEENRKHANQAEVARRDAESIAAREAKLRQELEIVAAENSKHAILAKESKLETARIAAREAQLRQELEVTVAENSKNANQAEAFKKEIVLLRSNFQNLETSSKNNEIQHQSEVVELSDELRKKQSLFNDWMNDLEEELKKAHSEADRKLLVNTREGKLQKQLEDTVAKTKEIASRETEAARKEVSSLREKYQNLKETSRNTQNQYQSEVVELKDRLRKKETDFNVQIEGLKKELRTTKSEAESRARNLELASAGREVKLRQEMEVTAAESSERAKEAEEAKEETSSLLAKYQKLKESSKNAKTQYETEVVDLKDILRKKESSFNSQLDGLKHELQSQQSEADSNQRDIQAAASAREAKLLKEMECAVENEKSASNEAEEAKKEISSLLEKYQNLRRSSVNKNIQRRREVLDLKKELGKKESHFNVRAEALKKELREAKLEADSKAQDLQAAGATREAKIREELEGVVAENKEYANAAREAKKEISSLLEKHKNLQKSTTKTQRQHQAEVAELKDELRKKDSSVYRLNREILSAKSEADRKSRDLEAGSEREAKLQEELLRRQESFEALSAENKERENEVEETKREISSLLQKYQDLRESSKGKDVLKYQDEVAGLKKELRNKETNFKAQMNSLKDVFRNAGLEAGRKTKAIEAAGKAREAKLRKELEGVVAENKKLQDDLDLLKERYTEEIMDWEDRLEGEQDVRMKDEREADIALRSVQDQVRKAFNNARSKANIKSKK